jgi:hypothetical protein
MGMMYWLLLWALVDSPFAYGIESTHACVIYPRLRRYHKRSKNSFVSCVLLVFPLKRFRCIRVLGVFDFLGVTQAYHHCNHYTCKDNRNTPNTDTKTSRVNRQHFLRIRHCDACALRLARAIFYQTLKDVFVKSLGSSVKFLRFGGTGSWFINLTGCPSFITILLHCKNEPELTCERDW